MGVDIQSLHLDGADHRVFSVALNKQTLDRGLPTHIDHDHHVSGAADPAKDAQYHPVIEEFRNLIEDDPHLYMLFEEMFNQVPLEAPYDKDPAGNPQVRDYKTMLASLDRIIRHAPGFQRNGISLEVLVSYLFQWPMATPAGSAVFLHRKVNAQLKRFLDEWASFLCSLDSTYVLSTDPVSGWFGQAAMAAMPNFASTYVSIYIKSYHCSCGIFKAVN